MLHYDKIITLSLNEYAQRSWIFDHVMVFIQGTGLFKGVVFMAVFWWVWFSQDQKAMGKKETLLYTLVGAFLALTVAKFLAISMPFTQRPGYELGTRFCAPFGMGLEGNLKWWSSFPSDHAALFFALATGFWFISRWLGIIAALYALLFILFPRLYCGLHYPSDIIGGTVLGVVCVLLVRKLNERKPLFQFIFRWSEKHQSSFYCSAFIFTYLLATMFDDVRRLGSGVLKALFHGAGS